MNNSISIDQDVNSMYMNTVDNIEFSMIDMYIVSNGIDTNNEKDQLSLVKKYRSGIKWINKPTKETTRLHEALWIL